MVKVKLNKRGEKIYPWLADTWFPVYGFNPNDYSFLIWDGITNSWKQINQNLCEGE